MGVVQCVGYAVGDADRLVHVQLVLTLQELSQRSPLHVRHHVIQEAVGLPGVEQRKDVGMLEVRGRLDLREEALAPDDGSELGPEHLDGDLPIVLPVIGQVHRGHSALAELAIDVVPIGQCRDQALRSRLSHPLTSILAVEVRCDTTAAHASQVGTSRTLLPLRLRLQPPRSASSRARAR